VIQAPELGRRAPYTIAPTTDVDAVRLGRDKVAGDEPAIELALQQKARLIDARAQVFPAITGLDQAEGRSYSDSC
jgi:hypothetical protein